MKTYSYSQDMVEELTQNRKKGGYMMIGNVIAAFVGYYLMWNIDLINKDNMAIATIIFLVIITFMATLSLVDAGRINRIILNVQKNQLKITDKCLEIKYVRNYSGENAEDFAEIPLESIKEIEVAIPSVKQAEYCNLILTTKQGIYKLSVDAPHSAMDTILETLRNMTAEG